MGFYAVKFRRAYVEISTWNRCFETYFLAGLTSYVESYVESNVYVEIIEYRLKLSFLRGNLRGNWPSYVETGVPTWRC